MSRKRKDLSEQVKESASKEHSGPKKISTKSLIPSGSTLLNCACSDNPLGAFGSGTIVTLPGSSSSGKTILTLSALAEINKLKRFADYNLYYDDGEEALAFDFAHLFNIKLEERLQAPKYTEFDEPQQSNTIQDFKHNILTKMKEKNPMIYILDSLDSLSSDQEIEKEYKAALAAAKSAEAVKELKGSYKTEKAKIIGEVLRIINGQIKKTDSLLVIVQQERAKLNAMFGKKVTTSGGMAPFYYSAHQVWLNKIAAIKDTITKKRVIGATTKASVTKNKITGKQREVEFNIYYDYGIDDITSCVEFLLSERWWKPMKGKKQIFDAEALGIGGKKPELIEQIEELNLEKKMQKEVGKCWNTIEESIRLTHRKRKY